ncbi:MAG: DedA family protein [Elusimicrobiota bacterium]|jgi:membrane-associated protein|nr:DedA family protein [Elusimicrobiota bacterium]
MEIIAQAFDIFLHLDVHLNALAAAMGPWLYVLLFVIIFCETGLVVTPFLPGDSLLFAVGALASIEGSVIKLPLVMVLLLIAAVLGDAANYSIGKYIGPKIFSKETGFWLNKKHLNAAHNFYEKYGGKTIILARFIPIMRTFAPFVAGIGKMHYSRFFVYNIVGAIAWVLIFSLAGYFFGSTPIVQKHFHFIIIAIIVISVLPAFYEFIKVKLADKK